MTWRSEANRGAMVSFYIGLALAVLLGLSCEDKSVLLISLNTGESRERVYWQIFVEQTLLIGSSSVVVGYIVGAVSGWIRTIRKPSE